MLTLPSVGGSSGKSPLRSNREHYLRLRKSQFIGSRNLYDFRHQPYAVWLQQGLMALVASIALGGLAVTPDPVEPGH